VSVSGVCLTAVEVRGGIFFAQAMGETLRSSKLGQLSPGDSVNLERAMPAGGRLDGHIVLGHVDEVGAVARIETFGRTRKLWVSMSEGISWGVAPKGSVALDGVSLTVIDSLDFEFSVGLIPATIDEAATTIGLLSTGDVVNIEIDVIARYVARLCGRQEMRGSAQTRVKGPLTWEKLAEYGWTAGGGARG